VEPAECENHDGMALGLLLALLLLLLAVLPLLLLLVLFVLDCALPFPVDVAGGDDCADGVGVGDGAVVAAAVGVAAAAADDDDDGVVDATASGAIGAGSWR